MEWILFVFIASGSGTLGVAIKEFPDEIACNEQVNKTVAIIEKRAAEIPEFEGFTATGLCARKDNVVWFEGEK